MMDDRMPAEERRAVVLLSELRRLEASVDVSDRVLRRIEGVRPGRGHRSTPREVAWGIGIALAASLAGMAFFSAAVTPAGKSTGAWMVALLLALRALTWAVFGIGRGALEVLDAVGKIVLAFIEVLALPAGRGQFPLYLATGFSVGSLIALLLSTAVLLWRDLRNPDFPASRRMS